MSNNDLSCYNPLPRESAKSFDEFAKIRDLQPHKRNLRKIAENNLKALEVSESRKNYSKELKREHNRLSKLSERWKWQERFKLYDIDKQIELMQKRDDVFYSTNNILLDNINGLIKYANNLLAELVNNSAKKMNGEDYSLGTKIKMTSDIVGVLKYANDLLCTLCGRPSDYSKLELEGVVGVNADVNVTKTKEELDKENKDYFNELNEEFLKENKETE